MAGEREILRNGLLGWNWHGFLTGIGHDSAPEPDLVARRAKLVTVKQVHSARAVAVEEPFAAGARPEADAMVTATPGIVLGIVTADCAPVLLCDRKRRVVGAAHAGWRGALGGVLEATVDAMVALGAERGQVRAVIGPTIAQASYQVDGAFRERMIASERSNESLFVEDDDLLSYDGTRRYRFDLPGYVRRRLFDAGIKAVANVGCDTYADPQRYHSFRRATHRGEATGGRQYSLIGLPGRVSAKVAESVTNGAKIAVGNPPHYR